jgi:cytochrome c556
MAEAVLSVLLAGWIQILTRRGNMSTRSRSKISASAVILAALMGGAATAGLAQTPTPPPAKQPQHQEGMKGMAHMSGMGAMMNTPHHVLAMAYRDNLVTFAKALRGRVAQSKAVDVEFARPAVVEMRRNFDQMKQHMGAQMSTMSDSAKKAMAGMMQGMETHTGALAEHLAGLEAEVGGSMPDPAKVTQHTREILKQCDAMSAMPGKAKPHMKP